MDWSKSKAAYIFVLLAACLFIYFFIVVKRGEPLQFDSNVSHFITSVFTEGSYPFFKLLNRIGSTIGIGMISLIVIAGLWGKKRDYAGMAVFVLGIAIGNLLNMWIKDYIARPRPELEHLVHVKSFSFPSGHAMMGMILYVFIAYFIMSALQSKGLKWLVAIAAGIFILLMGISRIVLHVHYPSDVAAGFALGFFWVFFCITCYETTKERLNRT
ncbi:phosphatase PAP2 family protein [Cytobacillus depressus]|uniref:Phosphatase PAP2 family protein n=1 Tax=Cytobacillus depressus TaxID=1602942 RepID=A0A6L3VBR9_9BACI|nr:phosphatase PAP2 family protein [Cytobacillus depressus]KAB2337140.1 phosphatase PAP2 family protein [Cytobacillus depressus]